MYANLGLATLNQNKEIFKAINNYMNFIKYNYFDCISNFGSNNSSFLRKKWNFVKI